MDDAMIAFQIGDGPVRVISDSDGNPVTFAHYEEAKLWADGCELLQKDTVAYQIITLDEL